MATEIESKHAIVSRSPAELYMAFTDMRNFVNFLPEDKKQSVQADFDTITASVQGYGIGVKVHDRVPYSRIELVDYGAPFAFHIGMHFDLAPDADPSKTDIHIDLSAELSFMMKMLVGNKLKEVLDKLVDGLASASDGQMPEGLTQEQIDELRSKYNI